MAALQLQFVDQLAAWAAGKVASATQDTRPGVREPVEGSGVGGADRLDIERLKGSREREGNGGKRSDGIRHEIEPCGCSSWVCPRCGMKYWARVRGFVSPHLGLFKRPVLLTLTVNRDNFPDGESAYRYVSRRGLLRRLLRLVGFDAKFLRVLAFHHKVDAQGREGREWPHWHILVDLADVANVRLARKQIWALWRDEWGVGGADLPDDKDPKYANRTGARAASYAFGYQQHQAGVFPSWVGKGYGTPRVWDVGGALREAIRKANPARVKRSEAAVVAAAGERERWAEGGVVERKRRRSCMTVAERVERCGSGGGNVFRIHEWSDGTVVKKWVGSCPLGPGQVALLAKCGYLSDVLVEGRWAVDDEPIEGTGWVPWQKVVVLIRDIERSQGVERFRDQVMNAWSRALRERPELLAEPLVELDQASDEAFGDEVLADGLGLVLGEVEPVEGPGVVVGDGEDVPF